MLKLYYTSISLNSRRVWVVLLEKQIAFEAIALNLDGDQFEPEFSAINPFHRIPILMLAMFGISFDRYPKLQQWCDRLMVRSSWQQTEVSQEEVAAKISIIKELLAARL